jgi:hypothetical protein
MSIHERTTFLLALTGCGLYLLHCTRRTRSRVALTPEFRMHQMRTLPLWTEVQTYPNTSNGSEAFVQIGVGMAAPASIFKEQSCVQPC